ncbi:MAG: hypothetical protein ACJAT2_002543 [Bacteriovoracaceae bacterium]|jgi:hypothetical protein
MKYIILTLFIIPSLSLAATKMVPLDMKPGLWEYKTDIGTDSIMAQAMANIPEAQRAMMKKMLEAKMKDVNKPVKQCLTLDQIKNPEKQFKEALTKNDNMKDCKMLAKKSTDKLFEGNLNCPKSGRNIYIKVVVKSPKHIINDVKMPMGGGSPKLIQSVGRWISSSCPK